MVLAEGHLDLDLELTARRPTEEGVRWERLFTQPLVLAVPDGHRLEDRDEVSLAEVAQEDFVMLRPSWELRTLTDGLCRAADFTARVAFEADDLPVVRGLVAAGLGVAVLPSDGGGAGGDRGSPHQVRITDDGAYREVGLAWLPERRLLPSAALFRQHVMGRGRRGELSAGGPITVRTR
jgi:LysR family transcriptional activator of glutamate synthase operon